jgi:tetratricopeptide (TPR) repeat protein
VVAYERALAYRPNYTEAYNNLGNVLKDQGKLEEAVASYRQALTHKPDFAQVHYNLGNALQDRSILEPSRNHLIFLVLAPVAICFSTLRNVA